MSGVFATVAATAYKQWPQRCQNIILLKVSQGWGAALGVQVKREVLGSPGASLGTPP